MNIIAKTQLLGFYCCTLLTLRVFTVNISTAQLPILPAESNICLHPLLPGLCSLGMQSASRLSPSPRKCLKPSEQADPVAEIDLGGINTNPSGKSVGKVKEVQIETSFPLGINSRTSTAARLMSTDPTLTSMFAHRLFMGATIPNNTVEIEGNQGMYSPPSSTLSYDSLEKKKEITKAMLVDTLAEFEDQMYTVIEYSKNIEPRDRVRWAKVLTRSVSPTSPSSSSSSGSCTLSSSTGSQIPSLANSVDVVAHPNLVHHPSYLRVKVTGGWMKVKGKAQQAGGFVLAGSAGSNDNDMLMKTDIEIGMTVEQRVRQRAALVHNQRQTSLQPQNEESLSLCGGYKRKLLEAVAASAYSAAHKKKTPSGDVKTTVGYYNNPLSSPLLFYLPSDGGLTATCVSCAPAPFSLQTLCASGEMCAFCLHRFEPNMRLYSSAQISHMAKKRREKERRAAAVRKKMLSKEGREGDYAEDSLDSALHLVSKKVGSVLHTIHQQCAFAVDNGWLSTSHFASHAPLSTFVGYKNKDTYSGDQDLISSSLASGSSRTCDVDKGVGKASVTAFKGIDLGDLYECDDGDDAECDLCGKAGGLMQFFDLHVEHSSQLPPGEEGWLGHIPCVSWLIRSRLLELPPSSIYSSRDQCDPGRVTVDRPYMDRAGDSKNDIAPDDNVKEETDAVLESSVMDGIEDVGIIGGEQEALDDSGNIQPSKLALDQSQKKLQPLSSSIIQQLRLSPDHKYISEKVIKKGGILQPLSLFDSLVGQWRCSLCGTYAGVVLRCAAVACTVRAHPLCVSIAGKGWSHFSIPRYCTTSPESAAIDGNLRGRSRGGQKIEETDSVIGFLCALHSVESKQ